MSLRSGPARSSGIACFNDVDCTVRVDRGTLVGDRIVVEYELGVASANRVLIKV